MTNRDYRVNTSLQFTTSSVSLPYNIFWESILKHYAPITSQRVLGALHPCISPEPRGMQNRTRIEIAYCFMSCPFE